VPFVDADHGELLFLRDGNLLAQPFDARRFELTADPVTVAEHVGFIANYGLFSASTNGVLMYRTDSPIGGTQLEWFDRHGKPLNRVGEPGFYLHFALSPDNTHVGVHSVDPEHPASIVLLVDLLRGTTSRFTFGPARAYSSAFSPDGKRIIFVSQHDEKFGLYVKPTNGEKDEELLLNSDQNMVATNWSHDGRFLLYETIDQKNYSDIWVLPLDGGKKPFPFLRTEFDDGQGYFSPDDHWVAYYSNESGRYEIYVRPFSGKPGDASGLGTKWLVSTAGGVEPRWRADGRELFYVALDGKLMAAEVTSGQVFQATIPKALFQTPVAHREFGVVGTAEVSSDGQRFLFAVAAEPTAQAPFIVVQNWQAGLKK
jgi:Tol biopolymer transport system component